MLVLTPFVVKHELAMVRRVVSMRDIVIGARKVLQGLAIPMKPPVHTPHVRFFKVRLGRKGVARMIVMVTQENNKVVPIMVRLKGDIILGANMAMNNPQVKARLGRNLDEILDDIEHKRYQEIPLLT